MLRRGARFSSRHYDSMSVCFALAFGVVTTMLVAAAGDGHVSGSYYAAAAQTLPVFLVALAVEQRFLNRLGMSEDAYVREAETTLNLWVEGRIAHENGDAEQIEIGRQLDARPKFKWVYPHAEEAYDDVPPEHQMYGPVDAAARERFARVRRGQAGWSAAAIVLLLVGLTGALAGLGADGTATSCAYYWMTTVPTATTFVLIALTAVREVVEDLALT